MSKNLGHTDSKGLLLTHAASPREGRITATRRVSAVIAPKTV